ncbi:MAG: DNA-binding protein [Pseudomonadota bacterium]
MKDKAGIVIVAVLFLVLLSSWAFAKSWRGWQGSGGWGMGTPYARLYNPAMADTLTGEVVGVEQVVPLKGMNSGVQLLIKTDKETIPVHLGPAWYVERLDIKIIKGDKVEVKGARVNFQDKPAIIAGEIKKGEAVLVLRDNNGVPVWAGWRR